MYKILYCACLLLLPPLLYSQHSDKIVTGIEPAFAEGVDEIIHSETSTGLTRSAPSVLKSVPLLNGKKINVEVTLKGRNKGDVSVQEGNTEIVIAGFKRNHLQGAWRSRYSNGQLLDSGAFLNNIPNGEWRSWFSNGQLRSIRNYRSDKWFAVSSEITRNNPKIYFYQLTKLVGFSHRNFETLTNSFSSFSTLQVEKNAYQPPFKYCLHHGLYMNFYSNGAVKDSGYFKDGLRDGLWNEYYSYGQLSAQGNYFHGLKNGGWKYLNKDGTLAILSEYHNGKLIYSKNYNKLREQPRSEYK